jgi:sec-independent protein translocase protein TatB
MFDISWSEFLLIGIVALIVIGPKELPAVMRTLGQWTRKVRGMASEFQNQFQEAMREAEMADLKKQVDDMAHGVTDIDPLKGVREDIENVGSDVQRSLSSTTEHSTAEQSTTEQSTTEQAAALPAGETDAALPAPATASPDATPAFPNDAAAPGAAVEAEQTGPKQATDAPHDAAAVEPAGATRTG